MKKLFNSSIFLFYIYILLFIIINIFIIFQIDSTKLFDSYLMIYSSWFLIIILIKFISDKIDFKEDENV